jgi:predicted dehydrogenase
MIERQPLSVAVAGVGRFGALHARVWREAGARVVGLCDVDERRARQVASDLSVSAVAPGLRALLDEVVPDVVVVVSDEASHADLAITALQAGCHVFVEKPLALSAADAWSIHRAAADVERQVVTGQVSRFAAPYARMHDTVSKGSLGRLCAMRFRRDFSREWFEAFGDRVHPVWESCIHDIDLAVSFAKGPVRRVMAMQSATHAEAAPSVVSALLEFDNGVVATIESAWLIPPSAPQTLAGALELTGSIAGEAELLGSAGVVRQRLISDAVVEWTDAGSTVPDLSLWPEEDGVIGGALRREVDYAIDVFSGRRAGDRVPLEEVCWGVEAAEGILKALSTQGAVSLGQDREVRSA